MKFRPRRTEEPEINLIPLIDVLLMTLIFLLVTTSFSDSARLQLQLPSAGSAKTDDEPGLRVAIDAQGKYFLNGRQILSGTSDALRAGMRDAAGSETDPIVVIQADRRTPHEAVIRVLDAARRLNFTHVTFATQSAGKDSE